jgi:hypothetical protein
VIAAVVLLGLSVALEPVLYATAYFPIAEPVGFNALMGLASGVAVVLVAWIWGLVARRGEEFYDD